MKKDNVISIVDRVESWKDVYTSPGGDVYVRASSHGRVTIIPSSGKCVTLPLVESINMLSKIADGISGAMDLIK
ncbi:MAG: hypothetical protein EBR82_00260 [Caulobacteraceae bacterium]|nr:hypothetical protein [Caulobacteraceae bacterium]